MPTDFAGAWKMVSISIPSRLTLDRNDAGRLVGIREWNDFDHATGDLIVSADGSVTGNVPQPFTATASPGDQGEILMRPTPGAGPALLVFHANASADLLVTCGNFGEGQQDLVVCVRSPATLTTHELAGVWSLTSLQSPYQLILQTNLVGEAVAVAGLEEFGCHTGTLTVLPDGRLAGVAQGPFAGNVLGFAPGMIRVSIATPEETNFHDLFINAAKDTMVMAHGRFDASNNYRELILLQKVPAPTAPRDLAGFWRMAAFDVPRLSEHKNAQGVVTHLTGGENFGVLRESLISGHDGYFTARTGIPTHGVITAGPGGQVSAQVETPEGSLTLGFRVNASGNVLAGANPMEWGHEFMLMTRAAEDPAPRQNFGLIARRLHEGIAVEWAARTNSALESSTNLVDWQTVPGTLGEHAFLIPVTNSPPAFYRVAQPSP